MKMITVNVSMLFIICSYYFSNSNNDMNNDE